MQKSRIEELSPDRSWSSRYGFDGVTLRWAVSAARSRSRLGSLAWIEILPGGEYPVERMPECERILYVADGVGEHRDGSGVGTTLWQGDGLLVPKGAWHGLRNCGSAPALLIALFAPYADASRAAIEPWTATDEPGPPVVRVAASEVDYDPDLRDDMGFVGLDVKWLVNGDTAGAEHMLFGLSRFRPGGSHLLHRHPHVEETIYVIDGAGHQLTSDGDVPVRTGDLTWGPTGEWHGHVADDAEMHFMFVYQGASTLEAAGYELHTDVASADR